MKNIVSSIPSFGVTISPHLFYTCTFIDTVCLSGDFFIQEKIIKNIIKLEKFYLLSGRIWVWQELKIALLYPIEIKTCFKMWVVYIFGLSLVWGITQCILELVNKCFLNCTELTLKPLTISPQVSYFRVVVFCSSYWTQMAEKQKK